MKAKKELCLAHSEEETIGFGKKLARCLRGGDIVLLQGELGAGKTTLVKGIAAALGIVDTIVSPTFVLMQIYGIRNSESGIKNFAHVDTYRLKNEQELVDIGIEDYLGAPDTLCVIEWPEKIERLLRGRETIGVTLRHITDKNREIVISNQ